MKMVTTIKVQVDGQPVLTDVEFSLSRDGSIYYVFEDSINVLQCFECPTIHLSSVDVKKGLIEWFYLNNYDAKLILK